MSCTKADRHDVLTSVPTQASPASVCTHCGLYGSQDQRSSQTVHEARKADLLAAAEQWQRRRGQLEPWLSASHVKVPPNHECVRGAVTQDLHLVSISIVVSMLQSCGSCGVLLIASAGMCCTA